jgi:hypothetical protein
MPQRHTVGTSANNPLDPDGDADTAAARLLEGGEAPSARWTLEDGLGDVRNTLERLSRMSGLSTHATPHATPIASRTCRHPDAATSAAAYSAAEALPSRLSSRRSTERDPSDPQDGSRSSRHSHNLSSSSHGLPSRTSGLSASRAISFSDNDAATRDHKENEHQHADAHAPHPRPTWHDGG